MDEATLTDRVKAAARIAVPLVAIIMPFAFFLSVLRPDATEPNGLIYFAYAGAVLVTGAVLTLGIGLIRRP